MLTTRIRARRSFAQARKASSQVYARAVTAALLLVVAAAYTTAGADDDQGPGDPRARNYLIVTASGYAGSAPLTQFVQAKEAQDLNVIVYSVPAGTSRTTIKNYILDLWGTAETPKYILLVGDTDGSTSTSTTIPHWTGGGSKASPYDLPYASLDAGDEWHPNV